MAQAKATGARRSPPPSRRAELLAELRRRLRDLWSAALERPWMVLVLFLPVAAWLLVPRDPSAQLDPGEAAAGAIASRDYVAPDDFPVEDRAITEEKKRKAREAVLPVYDFDSGAAAQAEMRIQQLFAAGRDLVVAEQGEEAEGGPAPSDEDLLVALQAASGLKLMARDLAVLRARGFAPALEESLRAAFAEILRRGVVSELALLQENRAQGVTLRDLGSGTESPHVDLWDHLDYPEDVLDAYLSEVRRWPSLSSRDRGVLAEMLAANTAPNLSPNSSETLARREAAAAQAEPVYVQIRKGQVIARKGDAITPAAERALVELASITRGRGRLLPLLGTVLLLLLVSFVLWIGLREERVADHSRERLFNEALLLLTLSCLGAGFGVVVAEALGEALEAAPDGSAESFLYGIPFAALALVARLLFGRAPALVLALLASILAGRQVGEEGFFVFLYSLGGSLAAIFVLDLLEFKQRLVIMRAGAVVGGVNAGLVLVLTALGGSGPPALSKLGLDLVCALAGGLVAAAVASFTVPVLEAALGITTDIKLVELSNTNLPLLSRLAFEAPGTFQHSLMVANLAREGTEAIGGDAILAYTAGLYHDVGKVYRPAYFIENQLSGGNPHDKLAPSMSALVLIGHVKDGLELARRYSLPAVLRDAIAQHHGTRLIGFFHRRAVERAQGEQVREEDYRYPGPRPRNKEMGLLMLADGIEAASRTLDHPSPLRIRDLIGKIFDDCLRDGQLDETELTLKDLNQVSEAFQRVLANIYHRRIDYPGFDFNPERRKEIQQPPEPTAKAS